MTERAVRGLGEIALRVRDLETMTAFYRDVVGLERMRSFSQAVFFRLAEGYGGHTQVLALFDRSATTDYRAPRTARSSVDHIAFTIDAENFLSERARLSSLGIATETAYHDWVRWQSLYFPDPEGNLVELVCRSEKVLS